MVTVTSLMAYVPMGHPESTGAAPGRAAPVHVGLQLFSAKAKSQCPSVLVTLTSTSVAVIGMT